MTENYKIKQLKVNESKVTVVFEGDLSPLTIPKMKAVDFQLISGVVITQFQYDLLLEAAEIYRCQQLITYYLTNREHSSGEIKAKLKRKKFSAEIIKTEVNSFIQQGLIDDNRFAKLTAERLIERKPCGRSFIIAYLQKKYVSRMIAETTADLLLGTVDLKAQAVSALEKRWSSWEQLELEDARIKSYNYLSRRGFSYDAARHAFDKLKLEKSED